MSTEKNVYEALRGLKTGEDDLDAAIVLRRNKKFPHACFHAQQAGEKALKAVWYFTDQIRGDIRSESSSRTWKVWI